VQDAALRAFCALAEPLAQLREVIVLREMNHLNYRDIVEITNVRSAR
jgi:DNA-directed RNA polymerase specialized sigma24 family protein